MKPTPEKQNKRKRLVTWRASRARRIDAAYHEIKHKPEWSERANMLKQRATQLFNAIYKNHIKYFSPSQRPTKLKGITI